MLASFLVATSGCNSVRERIQEPQSVAGPPTDAGGVWPVSDTQIIEDQDQHRSKVEVTLSAPVERLLPDDTQGNPHQKFLLGISNGTTVLVAHNTKLAPHIPIHEGDLVTIHGEFVWNKKGGLVHYTHHSTSRHHQSGWIQCNGLQYQ
jgi:hypothetical protein